MAFTIPDELVALFKDRRVIPFVGAGMSANVGYPSWDTLLENLADDLAYSDITHQEVVDLTNNDRLRIAEYYYLREGKQIGPLRRAIERAFGTVSPLTFGGYVDLVNLGAQRIYTTNFDDLIENSYRALEVLFDRIATPRDLALSPGSRTEIVKYHGDLTNDPSLVLTESHYYSRLNFESPMDLKFRADLLGKSVMFLGYSFSDINIRIIWFRLLDMMRGVDQTDIPTSYMVIVKPNAVEELLYRDAGLETIVLDPTGDAGDDDYRDLVSDFLYELSSRVCDDKIPGSEIKPFVSRTLIRRISQRGVPEARFRQRGLFSRLSSPAQYSGRDSDIIRLGEHTIPDDYSSDALELFGEILTPSDDSLAAAISLFIRYPDSEVLASFLVRSAITQWGMSVQDDARIDWQAVGRLDISAATREAVLIKTRDELSYHEHNFDEELFYAASLALDISAGKLGATGADVETANGLLRGLDERYPGSIDDLRQGGRQAISTVAAARQPDEEDDEDEDFSEDEL